ncbi:serine/threonine-protein kinase [Streptomyces hiroshimensis]|uniref:Serine/threonine protein kinase n=1 Tax=Streptomyces hiroshimensis TaxID=66424 RepID=A0ABQ2YZL7_9ACTN|nr:serine/threonine-protein kinase [Streptomyces hiroshimensis]GGX97341.1 serine/threonine protein kinase [Streptomyces hiroshimensis]
MAESRLIQGRYRLLERIGRGGMGEVWRALDESLGRQVAVKCLKPMGPRHEPSYLRVLRERFRREARVAAALQHRGITVIHDFGESEGVLYLVMELLDGRNLSELLEDTGGMPLALPVILEIAEQVAASLAYTHRQGVVHRDLKPANIMRLADGTVKICDFGIARLGDSLSYSSSFSSRLTGTGIAMGTPHYMSPEQIGGGPVDHRSDLYSLGCVLYEIATGAPPFDMDDAWAVLVGHRDTAPERPRTHRPELPEAFERIVLDLLAKDPDDRPPDAADLHGRLLVLEPPDRLARLATVHRTLPETRPRPVRASVRLPEPRLPGWARNMTTGSKATGPGPRTAPPPDPAAALTGAWTAGPTGAAEPTGLPAPTRGSGTGPEAVPGAGPAAGPEAFAPPAPEAVAALVARHQEGLRLGRLGRWEEAGRAHAAVAADRERLQGPEHPDTLTSRYEAAFALSMLGRPGEALREYARAASGRERVLGADHPATLAARQETAYVLGQLGRHFEAHDVYAAVLAARERTAGPDHPDTLRCRHNLAFNLGRLGRLEESYRMACEVAVTRSRVLGPAHPDTLVSRYEVGYALGQLNRWTEALQTYREVAVARQRVLGAGHPDTLAARYETGICLGRLQRSAEALGLFRDLVDERTRSQGPDDPDTLRARHCLGVNLGRLGRWEEALAEARDVCAVRERVLGADHPETLVSRREIAVGLGWLGRWTEALAVYREVAQARQRVLGADHPDALTSRNDEAHCLEQLGRSTEAVELYRQVAAVRRVGQTRGRPLHR